MVLYMTASLRLLRAARFALFLILFLGGELIQLSSTSSTNVTVPSAFTSHRDELRDYMCNGCNDESTCSLSDLGCTFCQWLCESSWGQKDSAEQTVCQKYNPGSSTLCDDDQSAYCTYGDDAEVCTYDDSDGSCMYYKSYFSSIVYKCCLCDLGQTGRAPLGMSCSNREIEEPTTRVIKTELPSTGEPLATVNVAAIVLGSVLSVFLVAVALGIICLFRTNKLNCGAGNGVTSADASIEMAQKDNERVQGQRTIASTNAHEDASTHDATTDHAYKALHLSHEQSHYYSRIPEGGGNPDASAARQEVTPSAPPIEGHELNTEAQDGHEYFVLEREQSKAESSNHEYFVLEKDEFSGEREVGRQEGEGDSGSLGKEVDSAIVLKPAATHAGYDHIKRPPQENITDNAYSHLNPNPGKEYDLLGRPGKT